nr:MAG: nucleocapsid protein [Centipede phenui-like virus]
MVDPLCDSDETDANDATTATSDNQNFDKEICDMYAAIFDRLAISGNTTLEHGMQAISARHDGFSIEKIAKTFTARGRAKGKSDDEIKHDLSKLALIYLIRGTQISKIYKRSKPEIQAMIITLVKVYGIRSRVGFTEETTLTLSRLACCVPFNLAYWLSKKYCPPVVPPTDIAEWYPVTMCYPQFASIIPEKDPFIREVLLKAHLLHQIKFDQVINRNKGTNVNTLISFQHKAISNKAFSAERREEWLRKLNIIDDGGKVIGFGKNEVNKSLMKFGLDEYLIQLSD